ncbi:MAG: hypothetical protein D6808_01575 [Candidatus Dadabacteria bacterium]|nr:MAG: hypothetical protein D6808_01575 [Candidatus Dadabacteria bacterium]
MLKKKKATCRQISLLASMPIPEFIISISIILATALLLAGCSNHGGASIGATAGAVAGGVAGKKSGSTAGGAVIGGIGGAAAGEIIDVELQKKNPLGQAYYEELERQKKDIERQRREIEDIKRQKYYDERLKGYTTSKED